MKYILTIKSDRYPTTGDDIEVDLDPIQVGYIAKGIAEGKQVPLYSTTKAKKKYGDCKLGDIISFKQIQND